MISSCYVVENEPVPSVPDFPLQVTLVDQVHLFFQLNPANTLKGFFVDGNKNRKYYKAVYVGFSFCFPFV